MRPTRAVVFPVPAPASTNRFSSSDRAIRSRGAWSPGDRTGHRCLPAPGIRIHLDDDGWIFVGGLAMKSVTRWSA
ncbi:MAG: hypothetical protein Ct9H300mP31_18570 [Acidimicrobiaceae bacterium]|nr:MAG: hypothetical protein Ct9H300mP31_18570 [Acidimicrobiaceae bacterium]